MTEEQFLFVFVFLVGYVLGDLLMKYRNAR